MGVYTGVQVPMEVKRVRTPPNTLPQAQVTGSQQLPNTNTRNLTQVFWKNSKWP